jgi:hypothetical protein
MHAYVFRYVHVWKFGLTIPTTLPLGLLKYGLLGYTIVIGSVLESLNLQILAGRVHKFADFTQSTI